MLIDHLMLLAQATEASNGNNDIVTVVYILTSISLIVGFIIGTYKYVQRQKKKWTEEGITRQRQAQAVQENTAMMSKLSGLTEKNTDAIDKLSGKFGEFAAGVRTEMNGLGNRIERLETWRRGQLRGQQDDN